MSQLLEELLCVAVTWECLERLLGQLKALLEVAQLVGQQGCVEVCTWGVIACRSEQREWGMGFGMGEWANGLAGAAHLR